MASFVSTATAVPFFPHSGPPPPPLILPSTHPSSAPTLPSLVPISSTSLVSGFIECVSLQPTVVFP
ncbi:hypothetical protein E2C01_050401 [Portunus trituberculatus]|uniref:Uncharacterized protein n=1 Tax=Portunus trituberculatus TaxID=210409 RepID=A0A5B7G861_PORTR|nr:hypothetical protein [Portunus trituberculatus]